MSAPRKLVLKVEVVRTLSADELHAVAGGYCARATDYCPSEYRTACEPSSARPTGCEPGTDTRTNNPTATDTQGPFRY